MQRRAGLLDLAASELVGQGPELFLQRLEEGQSLAEL